MNLGGIDVIATDNPKSTPNSPATSSLSFPQLIITGRDAVQRVVESFWKRRNMIIREEAAMRDSGVAPPSGGTGGTGLGGDFPHNKRR